MKNGRKKEEKEFDLEGGKVKEKINLSLCFF
jgi:hypothetical protein